MTLATRARTTKQAGTLLDAAANLCSTIDLRTHDTISSMQESSLMESLLPSLHVHIDRGAGNSSGWSFDKGEAETVLGGDAGSVMCRQLRAGPHRQEQRGAWSASKQRRGGHELISATGTECTGEHGRDREFACARTKAHAAAPS